ncbi:MAG: reverse transcriptase/maturase family protein [Nanoarchaeota archaeon]|nr:reverse transcriptase/maturase family protein [Nanoarchaeota archaeon]
MKTYKNLFQEVCKFENLYTAYLKARRGKNNVAEVLEFTYNLENELFKLQDELRSQTYQTGEYRHFIIFEPKERKISALPFRDRVVHHAICYVIEQIFEKKFIYDSYACRKGKGTHAGANRLQMFIRNADNYYVLKCDVSKYFPSVNHEILKEVIREKIADKKLLQLLDRIIDSPQEGIPIGNLTSQLFANIYLNKLDEYVKYELKIKYYIRYMDDFVMLHESKKYLHEVKEKVRLFFISMRLTLHPKKADIFPIELGIDFLGYRIFNNHKLVRKSTVKRFLKNVKGKLKEYDYGSINFNRSEMPCITKNTQKSKIFDKLMESFNSWEAYMDHGNSYNLKKSLHERYFKNVM